MNRYSSKYVSQKKVNKPSCFIEKAGDFPELSGVVKNNVNNKSHDESPHDESPDDSHDYKNIMLNKVVPDDVELTECIIMKKKGWVCITQSNGFVEDEPREVGFNIQCNYQIYNMYKVWEKYKENYIELHGEEMYYNIHEMPNYYYEENEIELEKETEKDYYSDYYDE